MALNKTVTLLEHCWVAPQPGTTGEHSLPLTFFDVLWLYFQPMQRLVFYELPISRTHFIETIIPKLKNSLAFALKHFFPLAGNLVISTNSSKPEIRYHGGDSVSLIFAEYVGDFNNLTANHARSAEEFYPLVPQLPEANKTDNSLVAPVLALQVTLFPGTGLCVGITNHHVVGDASSIFNFMRAWASISKFGEDTSLLTDGSLPVYDRNLIKDPHGIHQIFLSQVKNMMQGNSFSPPTNTSKVRATFIVTRAHAQRLKSLVSTERPRLQHVSTFTVVCGYVWACMVRSRGGDGKIINQDELDHFVCAADCRARLDPPIPGTYFGNSVAPCVTSAKTARLMEDEGFITAAETIGEAIRNRLHSKEGVLKGAERWLSEIAEMNWSRLVGVAGSPKFNYYDLDFGWGKGKKFEFVSIDGTGSMSLNGCRQSEGDIEVGLCFPKAQMDAFTAFFVEGLKSI